MPIGSSGDISMYLRSLDWHGGGVGCSIFRIRVPFSFFISVINREFLDGDVSMNRRSRKLCNSFLA